MSRRFGRNQRRAMRQQIEAAGVAIEAATDRADRYYRDQNEALALAYEYREQMDRWAQQIRHILGPNHAFLRQLQRIEVRHDLNDGVNFAARPPLSVRCDPNAGSSPTMTISTFRAFLTHIRMERSRDYLENTNRYAARISNSMGEAAIALDRETVESVGLGPREATEIGEVLVDLINANMRETIFARKKQRA